MSPILALPLLFLAVASPTLTLLKLWQLKEWRWDRLSEHMSREGWLKQIFGWLRPTILSAWLLLGIVLFAFRGFSPLLVSQLSALLLLIFASLTCAQAGFKKQPRPFWTSKAISMTAVSFALPLVSAPIISWSVEAPWELLLIALLPFCAPVSVSLAWLLLKPLDSYLKASIILRAIASRRAHPKLTVIGVTGSVGKTTTKELLAHTLKPLGAIATPAHLNSEVAVARWLTSVLSTMPVDEPHILIIEMGAYRAGEISLLARITEPQLGIVTYIGNQHLSLFGSHEAIRAAKGELLSALPANGHAFLNRDNDAFDALRALCRCPVTSVGTDPHADITAFDVEEAKGGIRFRALDTLFEVPVTGTHNVTGILFTIAVARHLGMSVKEIAAGIRSFTPLKHTFELTTVRGVTVLDDTYNLSPMSFRAAIEWAKEQPHKHKMLLMDGIIELGSEEAKIHQSLALSAATVFETAYIVSPRFLTYFRSAFGERAIPANVARSVRPGDLLVCAGRMPRSLIERLLPPT